MGASSPQAVPTHIIIIATSLLHVLLVRYNNVHQKGCGNSNHIFIRVVLYNNHAHGLHQVLDFYRRIDVKKAAYKLRFKLNVH